MAFFSKIYGHWNELQRKKYEKILKMLKKEKISLKGRVLDIGCGPFFFEKFLEENGIDTGNFTCIDPEKQELGKNEKKRKFFVADGGKIPFPKNRFSLAFCIDSIHLIPDAKDIHRVIIPGGFLVVSSFFNEQNLRLIEGGLEKKLNEFKMLRKIILKGEESEIILLCKKPSGKE